jgi:hypothetical protein
MENYDVWQGTNWTRLSFLSWRLAMPALIVFVIKHFANGFLLGAAAALAAVLLQPESVAAHLVAQSPTALALVVFALGSSLGMASLATALWLDATD